MIASTRLLPLIFLFKKVFLLRFWLVQSENTFLTLSWEVKANTQFFRVRSAITPKFVRETIASKIWKSSLCSFSSTTTFQACLTEYREDIRRCTFFQHLSFKSYREIHQQELKTLKHWREHTITNTAKLRRKMQFFYSISLKYTTQAPNYKNQMFLRLKYMLA